MGLLSSVLESSPPASAAPAAASPSVIRDAEIEATIRSYANPLFRASGIPPESVVIRVLNSSDLNAFVTSGNRMFIHSGLIMKTATPGQLIGVIAHETGHIAGGHMARLGDEVEKASMTAMASMALGALAGIASGRGDVGMAAMALGQQAAMRDFFAYTRTQESAADQFALHTLDDTGQSAQGLLDFFEVLGDQELLSAARQDPYVRTHPLTSDRIDAVRNHVETVHIPYITPSDQQARHDRMTAKLYAFLQPQGLTLQRYPEGDQRSVARYARSIVYFRRGDIAHALPLIDSLLQEAPNDPYYWELKGQMLFENGRLPEAQTAYQKAVMLAPEEPLIAFSLAHTIVELGNRDPLPQSSVDTAERVLRKALTEEPNNSFGWRLLGNLYGQTGRETQASYAMAEYALLAGEKSQAAYYADKALQGLKQSDPLWLRLQDIKQQTDNDKKGPNGGRPDRQGR